MSTNVFEAIKNHDLDQLSSLLARGVSPNVITSDSRKWTPLHMAIDEIEEGGSIHALILLLRYGADIEGLGSGDATPLLMAIFRDQIEAVHLLLASGADTDVIGSEGDTPLRWYVENRNYDMLAMIIRCGVKKTINKWGVCYVDGGYNGMTPLGVAASRLDTRMFEMLVQAGADIEALDDNGLTAYQRLPSHDQIEDEAGRRELVDDT